MPQTVSRLLVGAGGWTGRRAATNVFNLRGLSKQYLFRFCTCRFRLRSALVVGRFNFAGEFGAGFYPMVFHKRAFGGHS
jgi:hypothetical protein